MRNKILILITVVFGILTFNSQIIADGHKIYGPFPITLKGYSGDKTNSVKYIILHKQLNMRNRIIIY